MAEGSGSSYSVPLLDATATGATTSESVMPTPFFADNTGTFCQESFFTQPVSMRQLIAIPSSYSPSSTTGLSTFRHALYVATSPPIRLYSHNSKPSPTHFHLP